jgi:hypothetical protein
MKHEEHEIQSTIAKYLDYMKVPFFAVPNGEKRTKIAGTRLKREGVKRGVADLFVMLCNQTYGGLFIEVKTKTGTQSKEQKEFEARAIEQGYCYKIARSLDDVIKIVTDYKKII